MAQKPGRPQKKKESSSLFVNEDSEDSDPEIGTTEERVCASDEDDERVKATGGTEQAVAEELLPTPSNTKKKIAIKPTMTDGQTQGYNANLLRMREMLASKNFFNTATQAESEEENVVDGGTELTESQDEEADNANTDDNEDSVASPKKRSRQSSKKTTEATASKAKKTAPKPITKPKVKNAKKKSTKPTITSRSLLHSDLLSNAARAQHAPDLPTYQAGPRRDEVLKALMASLPETSRKSKQARADKKYVDNACKVFGPHQVKPREGGMWKVAGMKTTLKAHQILGTAFMLGREAGEEEPRGGVLADEMGLGKTIMTLALIVSGRPKSRAESGGTTLIVVAASLLEQWFDEIMLHCEPRTKHPKGVGECKVFRSSQEGRSNDPLKGLFAHDILITTYEEVAKSYPLRDPPPELTEKYERDEWWADYYEESKGLLHQMNFYRIVLDEAHMIRNPGGKKARACLALNAQHRWCLTGTPCVNGVFDLWSLLTFIQMPLDYGYDTFKATFCTHQDDESEATLTEMLAKSMIRRTHADQLFDARIVTLPDLESLTFLVNFNPIERAVYEIIETSFRERVNTMAKDGTIIAKSGSVWAMIVRLRQLTAHALIVQDTMLDLLEREDYEKLNELAKTPLAQGTYSVKLIQHLKRALARANQLDLNGHDVPTYSAPGDAVSVNDTLNHRLQRHLTSLKRRSHISNIADIKQCVECHKQALDPYVTSCMHVYCATCLNEAQHEAAERGMNGATCGSCGSSFVHTESCSATLSSFDTSNTPARRGLQSSQIGEKRKRPATKLNVLPEDDEELQEWLDGGGNILPSAKSVAIKKQISEWVTQEPDAKIIVYTQWLPMIKILSQVCREEKWGFCQYTGQMSTKARTETIASFKADPNNKIMLASLKCGGLGLNLTMANKVICLDPWWNNAVEQQAFARVYRIGQTKETALLSLVVKDTIDQRMQATKKNKQIDIDSVMDDNQVRQKLGIDGMMELFGKVRVNADGVREIVSDAMRTSANNSVNGDKEG